jgi:hypothetical protein
MPAPTSARPRARANHVRAGLLAALAVGTLGSTADAQQVWSPLVDSGATGRFVQGAPHQPRVLQAGFPGFPAFEWSYADGTFELRREALPSDLALVQTAAYDPTGARSVAYLARFTGLGGATGDSLLGLFDGARWTVVATPNVPPRQQPALAPDPVGGGLVLFGGVQPTFAIGTALADTWRLVGADWQALSPAVAPTARFGAGAAVDSTSGRLVLFGGRTQTTAGTFLADTWQWTGSTWVQLAPAVSPSARAGHALATDRVGGGLLLYGGTDASGAPLGDAWRFDGSTWTPLPAPQLGTPLTSAEFANVGADVVLFGRSGASPGVQRALRFTGSGWQEISSSSPITTRFYAGYALDTLRHEVVRFGGRDLAAPFATSYRDDTWVFDGAWRLESPATVPPARNFSRLAFDPLRGEVVMFGGSDASGDLDDTWVWDGTDWTERFPATSPPAMNQHTLVFDPTRGGVVLHGGTGPTMSTWLWSGSDWSQVATTGQTAAAIGSLAFDAARNVLCFYANGGSVTPSSLWELQGNAWVQVDATAPAFGQLAFDPVTGNLALFALNGRHDFAGGVWVPTGQPSVERDYAHDPVRGGLLALSSVVSLSTATPAATEPFGTGCGAVVDAALGFDRRPLLGAGMRAVVRAGAPGSAVLVFFGFAPANLPFGACTQWIDALFLNVAGTADNAGWAALASSVPAVPALAGFDVWAQAFVAYPAPLAGQFGLSNGVRLELGL